nr:MAG TPA: tail tape measure protein [Caudoviricetes sp.]
MIELAEYDGSIKFNTKLDTSGFEEGINKLQTSSLNGVSTIKNVAQTGANSMQNLKGNIKTVNNETANLGGTVKSAATNAIPALGKMAEEYTISSLLLDSLSVSLQTYFEEAIKGNYITGLKDAAFAGLSNTILRLTFGVSDYMTAFDDLHDQNEATIQSLNEEKDAWGDLKGAMEQNTVAETAKVDRAIALQAELAKIADETGRVSNADKERASYILGEMNEALGTEFTMTGNVIDQYGTMTQKINEVSDASKARAVLEANQQLAAAARAGQEQKILELGQQRVLMEDTIAEHAALSAERQELLRKGETGEAQKVMDKMRELRESLQDQQKTYDDTKAQAEEYSMVLEKYGAIEEAIANGSAKDITDSVTDFLETVKTGDTVLTDSSAAVDAAGERLKIAKGAYQEAADAVAKGADPQLLETSKKRLLEAADGYAEVGGTAMAELLSGFETGDDQLLTGLAAIAGVSVDTLKQSLGIQSPSSVMSSEVGAPMVQGITVGAQSESGILNAAMRKIVRDAINAAKDEGVIESPSHVMRDEVGLMFSKGLALGITDGKDEVVSAAEGVANAAISAASSISAADVLAKLSDSFINGLKENDKGNTEKYQDKLEILDYKQAFGGLSTEDYYAEMERLRDQYLTAYTKEWFDATEKIYDHQKEMAEEARDKALDELDKQHDKGLMSEAQYIAELTAFRDRYYAEGTEEYAEMTEDIAKLSRENELDMLDFHYDMGLLTEQDYYQKLLEYRDKHFAVGSAEWMEYTKKICSYNKSQIQKAYDEIAEYAGEKLSDLLSKQEALYGKLDGYGSLMKTVTVKNYYEDGSDLQFNELNDISKDNDFLRQYNENITAAAQRLKASGLDEAAAAKLYDELLGMSPEEASDFAALLTKATDEEFEKYLADYKENMDLLDEVSKNPFREEWKEATEDIVLELKEAGFEVPEAFSDIGEDSAMEFSRSFLEELQTQMEDIKTQITGWSFTLVPQVVGASANGESRVFSPTYHLYGSGETDVQRIQSAKAISEQHRMAGGY